MSSLELQIQVGLIGEGDAEEIDQLTRQLLSELGESDFAFARLAEAVPPEHSKAAGAVSIGSLFVGFLPSAFPKLVSYFQNWLKRGAGRTIKIKAGSKGAFFEVECPVDALDEDQIKALLEKLSGPVASGKSAQPRKATR